MKEEKKTKAKPAVKTSGGKPKGAKSINAGRRKENELKVVPLPGTGSNGPI